MYTSYYLCRYNFSYANKAIADKAWTEKVMISQALTPTGGSPEDLVAILEAKRKLGAELARIAKLKYD